MVICGRTFLFVCVNAFNYVEFLDAMLHSLCNNNRLIATTIITIKQTISVKSHDTSGPHYSYSAGQVGCFAKMWALVDL